MLNTMTVRNTIAAILAGLSMSAHAIADPVKPINVPAGELVVALETLSRQAAVDLVFQPDQLKPFRTDGVSGAYTPQEAIRILLKGTPLQLHTDAASGAMVIAPPATPKKIGSDAATSANEEKRSLWSRLRLAQSSLAGGEGQGQALRTELVAEGGAEPQNRIEVEEVIVTAQKRAERLIDTPQSVSVLSADYMARAGAVQFRDFADTVPGLTFTTQGAGHTQINLRGVTSGNDISQTVAIYVDDVPYGSSGAFLLGGNTALDVALFDLDRIEVLRGPQGTLYGAASMGGLIKYVTRLPDLDAFGGDARAAISNTQHGGVNFNGAAAINVPIVADKLALRVSGFESRDGGYIDNAATGREDVNRSDTYGGRLDLLYKPAEALSFRLNGFLQNISRDGHATADYTQAGAARAGELDQIRGYPEPFDQQFVLLSGTVNYQFAAAELTSISSYQTADTMLAYDESSIFVPLLAGPAFGNRDYSALGVVFDLSLHRFTQEIRLASSGRHRVDWLIGGVYTHETARNSQWMGPLDPSGHPAPNDLYTVLIPSRYEDRAVFGDLTLHVTDRLDVTGGLRYAKNSQTISQIGSGLFGGSRPTRSADDEVATYLANARYRFTDHATGYIRYATGYRPGGPNIVLNNPTTGEPLASPTFDPDKLKSYEIGFKSQTPGRLFSVDVAAYYIDWDDIQIVATRNNVGVRANAPNGATVRGSELAIGVRPLDHLSLSGAFAYQNAELAGPAPDLGGADGERLINVPRFTGTLSADYTFQGSAFRPTIGATVRHVSERRGGFDNSTSLPQYILPSYTVVDLRTGGVLSSVNVQLYVHNLLDRRAQLSEYTLAGTRVAISQPRTIGIAAFMSF